MFALLLGYQEAWIEKVSSKRRSKPGVFFAFSKKLDIEFFFC
jgi:hypothetical protein